MAKNKRKKVRARANAKERALAQRNGEAEAAGSGVTGDGQADEGLADEGLAGDELANRTQYDDDTGLADELDQCQNATAANATSDVCQSPTDAVASLCHDPALDNSDRGPLSENTVLIHA